MNMQLNCKDLLACETVSKGFYANKTKGGQQTDLTVGLVMCTEVFQSIKSFVDHYKARKNSPGIEYEQILQIRVNPGVAGY